MNVVVNATTVACGLGGCAAEVGEPCVNSVNQAPRDAPHMNRLAAAVGIAAYRPTPHLDAVQAELADWMRAAGQARAERDLARAELASARTELKRLRAELAQRTPTWPKVTTTTEGAPPA